MLGAIFGLVLGLYATFIGFATNDQVSQPQSGATYTRKNRTLLRWLGPAMLITSAAMIVLAWVFHLPTHL
jgi:hypothetical protein